MGHGELDDKVPWRLGKAAADVMRKAGHDVDWRCYEGQGHWYKVPEQIDDIVDFITNKVGWEACMAMWLDSIPLDKHTNS